jgi:hypothetical protein
MLLSKDVQAAVDPGGLFFSSCSQVAAAPALDGRGS